MAPLTALITFFGDLGLGEFCNLPRVRRFLVERCPSGRGPPAPDVPRSLTFFPEMSGDARWLPEEEMIHRWARHVPQGATAPEFAAEMTGHFTSLFLLFFLGHLRIYAQLVRADVVGLEGEVVETLQNHLRLWFAPPAGKTWDTTREALAAINTEQRLDGAGFIRRVQRAVEQKAR